jgi:hypothetical protein
MVEPALAGDGGSANPCDRGWVVILRCLGGRKRDDLSALAGRTELGPGMAIRYVPAVCVVCRISAAIPRAGPM